MCTGHFNCCVPSVAEVPVFSVENTFVIAEAFDLNVETVLSEVS
jgi:hypothetical protein